MTSASTWAPPAPPMPRRVTGSGGRRNPTAPWPLAGVSMVADSGDDLRVDLGATRAAHALHELRDAPGKVARILDGVAADQCSCLVEHHDHVLGLLGVGGGLHRGPEPPDHLVAGVDIQDRLVP